MKQMHSPPTVRRQGGLTLAEVMVSLTLGLLLTLAALSLFVGSNRAQGNVDEIGRLHESGSLALDAIARTVRQGAYVHWDKEDAPIGLDTGAPPHLAGLDGAGQNASTAGMDTGVAAVNQSDVLAVSYLGAGTGGNNGDGSVVNCAGFGVAAPDSAVNADTQRGWSIFYVASNDANEPELRCKYTSRSGTTISWQSDAIVPGVESFQVLYGVDTNGNGDAERYYSAAGLNALDSQIVAVGNTADERAADRNRKSWWRKIVTLKLALLLRSARPGRVEQPATVYDMFGPAYSSSAASADAGAKLDEAGLPAAARNRLRKLFRTTILLRNPAAGGPA